MIKSAIILFLATILGGFVGVKSVELITNKIKHLLVFAGSFLFSITILHILPELFESGVDYFVISLAILAGFFFQQLLEYFSHGVEHGHMHVHHNGSGHSSLSGITLMIALCIHAFLEGTLLAHPEAIHASHTEGTLLAGIVLHKVPAALALMSVLSCHFKSLKIQMALLIAFSLASPAGIFTGNVLGGMLSTGGMVMLFAFVAGNFLHISTTIFIESSPEHRWNGQKMIISLLGAGIAVIAEVMF